MLILRPSLLYLALACCLLISMSSYPVHAQGKADTSATPLLNPDFEKGMDHWYFQVSKEAKAKVVIDKEVMHSGKMSLRMSNQTPKAPNVFGGLYQILSHLTPMTQYRLTFWCKADAAKNVWCGGGPEWKLRKAIPDGTYDWKQLELIFQTGIDETQFHLRFNVDNVTSAIWLDDMSLEAIGPGKLSIATPNVSDGIPASAAFYPAFQGISNTPAVLHLRDAKDQKLGADITMYWDQQGLHLSINVLDPTRDAIQTGLAMWASDSIQLGLETQLNQAGQAYSATSMELGLTVDAKGTLHQYAWHPTDVPTQLITGQGKQRDDGYNINALIPWQLLKLTAENKPDVLGINLVINDGNNGDRRFVAWTPGITKTKNPAAFAQLHLLDNNATSVQTVILDDGVNMAMDVKKAMIYGKILRFAVKPKPSQTIQLLSASADGSQKATLESVQIPQLNASQCSLIPFALPASQMPALGDVRFILTGVPDRKMLAQSMTLQIIDYENSLKNQLQSLTQRFDAFNTSLAGMPQLSNDAQLQMKRYIVERFIKRVENSKQSMEWSTLQLLETGNVLDEAQARFELLKTRPEARFTMSIPTGPIHHQDGLLWTKDDNGQRPVFLYGYGHFAQVERDLPNMNTLGATLIQRERGPRDADASGKLTAQGKGILKTIDDAQANGVKMELLLSPHYFPQWAIDEASDVMIQPTPRKFLKYNIDHPVARKAISQWLDAIVPAVSDHPNLFSLCLANEPVYEYSGHDPYSRPAFTASLQQRYQTIARLNALYQTSYASFEEVPLPETAGDDAPTSQRLAYYDWVRFNQRHFADWMAWMHQQVKEKSSKPMTHIKQMVDIYDRSTLSRGTDPEMITSITDLAGNDCWAFPSPGGTWCYSWQHEHIWYDLLHAFKGQAVFNSENHFIVDNSPAKTIAPDLTRSVLWQGMLHHVAASTLWVWEEDNGITDLMGSIYFRPGNIQGASAAMIHGNQFANELAAFNQQKAQVALLYSYPSIYWQPDHPNTVTELYTALTLRGYPVTFISENQLASGERTIANDDVKVLLLPHATHITDAAIKGISKFIADGGKVIAFGQNNASFDDFGQPRSQVPNLTNLPLEKTTELTAEKLCDSLAKLNLNTFPLQNTSSGKPAWGVEYRVIEMDNQYLVSMTNFNNNDLTVSLSLPQPGITTGMDLLQDTTVQIHNIALAPAQSRLIRINRLK